MKILFFDTAHLTGWACGVFDAPRPFPEWGRIQLRHTDDDFGSLMLQARREYGAIMDRFSPDLVGYESPIVRRIDGVRKLRKLFGFVNEVEACAVARKIPCVEERSETIRAHFLGPKRPKKSAEIDIAVKVRCRLLGWDVEDDNEADALAGMDYLMSLQSRSAKIAYQGEMHLRRPRAAP